MVRIWLIDHHFQIVHDKPMILKLLHGQIQELLVIFNGSASISRRHFRGPSSPPPGCEPSNAGEAQGGTDGGPLEELEGAGPHAARGV